MDVGHLSLATILISAPGLIGTVSSDSAGIHALVGAEITIPALNVTTRTNFAGDYHLAGLTGGRYLVLVRAAGFKSIGDSVTIAPTGDTYRDFVLPIRSAILADVATLDTVRSTADSGRKYTSPALRAFEQRRKEGFGHFITEQMLRKEDDRPLADVLRVHVPGVEFRNTGSGVYLTSQRVPGLQSQFCYPDVYMDGVQLAKIPDLKVRSVVAVDLRQFVTSDMGAVEFYAGGATLPIQFNHTASGCGALLLWTRER